jgi:polar amino acid transport system substrate-binding protein
MRRLAPWSIAALLAIAMVAILAACGSSSSTSSSASPSATASTTTAAAPWTAADLAAVTTDPSLRTMLPAGSLVKQTSLTVLSDIPYPPWEYYTTPTSRQVTGVDYDLAMALGKKIGIPTSFVNVPNADIILAILGGKGDMLMEDEHDTVAREKSGVSFVAYAYNGTAILVPKGNPNNITGLNSLAGKTVCCEIGTIEQTFLQTLNAQFKAAGKKSMTVLALPNEPADLIAVTSGRAVGYLGDLSVCDYVAKSTNGGNTYQVVSDPSAPIGYSPLYVGIGIPTKKAALVTTVQKALQDLITDGTYHKILASYGLGLAAVTSAHTNLAGNPVSVTSPSASSTP